MAFTLQVGAYCAWGRGAARSQESENCSLVVTGGAHATVNEHTSFTADRPHIVHMVIDSVGSSVTADQVSISGGRVGVIVQSGAHLSATHMHMKEVGSQAFAVQGPESSLQLKHCSLQGQWTQESLSAEILSQAAENKQYRELAGNFSRYLVSAGIVALDNAKVSVEDVSLKHFTVD